jgi:hypothetical protein
MQNFKVLREHHGDKPYARGDTRLADASEVAHLVRSGVLELAGTDENEKVDEAAPLDNPPITEPEKSPENKAPKQKATEAK